MGSVESGRHWLTGARNAYCLLNNRVTTGAVSWVKVLERHFDEDAVIACVECRHTTLTICNTSIAGQQREMINDNKLNREQ